MKKAHKNDRVRLLHMLDAAQEAVQFAIPHTRRTLGDERLLQLALARLVAIIGEAASHITDDFQAAHPQIEWGQIKGMRNRLVHAYFDIDLDILWEAVTDDLPLLAAELQKIIPADEE